VFLLCIDNCCGVTYRLPTNHPHGFLTHLSSRGSVVSAAMGPKRILLKLKSRSVPTHLRYAVIIKQFQWKLISHPSSVATRRCVVCCYCCFRCVSCLMQVLFALNGQYWMNEKGALALASTFAYVRRNQARINNAFAQATSEESPTPSNSLRNSLCETEVLVSQSKFQMPRIREPLSHHVCSLIDSKV